jgi:hypothetical protein
MVASAALDPGGFAMNDGRPGDTESVTPPTSGALDAACDGFEGAW